MNDQPTRRDDEPAGGQPEEDARRADERLRQYEDPVDDAADDSFPASDPPSFSDTTATRNPQR